MNFLLLLISQTFFPALATVHNISLPFRGLGPLDQILLLFRQTRINCNLRPRALLALRSFLSLFIKAIVRSGTKLSVALLAGPFKMGIVFYCPSVCFAVEEEVGINFYFLFDKVMEGLNIRIWLGLLPMMNFVIGMVFFPALVHGVEKIVMVELSWVGSLGKFAHERLNNNKIIILGICIY